MKKNAGFMYGPDGAVCNPFIGDSYLFMNNSVNDTNNFGHGQPHSSQETTAMNGPAGSYSNYMSQPTTSNSGTAAARRSLSGNQSNAIVAPQIINQMKDAAGSGAEEAMAQAKRSSGDIVIRRHHSISSKKNQSLQSGRLNSSQASNNPQHKAEGNVTLSSGSHRKKQTPHDPEVSHAVLGSNGATRKREPLNNKKTSAAVAKSGKKSNSSSRNTQIFTDHNNLSKSVSQRNIGSSLQTYDVQSLMMKKGAADARNSQQRSSQQIVSRQKSSHRESQELFEQRSTSKKNQPQHQKRDGQISNRSQNAIA